jgi:general secretion pathway protein J
MIARPLSIRLSLRRARARALTLLEVLISVGILALVASLIYGAFDGMSRSRAGISRLDERYQQGRNALSRMSRELQSAFLSMHQPPVQSQWIRQTAFVGKNSGTQDRVDFTSFSHKRLGKDLHESDQNELSYFMARDPDRGDKYDLVRREQKEIDLEPTKGGVINVICEDVESFDLSYMDPISGEWTETWDSTQAAGQAYRLPLQVKIKLVLRGGVNGLPIKLETRVPIAMQSAISFGISNPQAQRGGGARGP